MGRAKGRHGSVFDAVLDHPIDFGVGAALHPAVRSGRMAGSDSAARTALRSRISASPGTGHFAASVRTFAAGLCAILAVVHVVLGAFLATGVTYFRAESADPFRELRLARHFPHRKGTDVGTAAVQFDAAGHRLDVFFVQARRRAMFARSHALVTRLALLVVLVGHFIFLRCCAARGAAGSSAPLPPGEDEGKSRLPSGGCHTLRSGRPA